MPTGKSQRGYTYLLVLFAVAALGLLAAEAGIVWQAAVRREREAELLVVGAEIARAIGRYYAESPGTPAWPTALADLLQDPRFPTVKRHLRRIYRDPLTGRTDWVLIREGQAIVGLRSRATGEPIRKVGLPPELGPNAGIASGYGDWIFRPLGDIATGAPPQGAATPAAGALRPG